VGSGDFFSRENRLHLSGRESSNDRKGDYNATRKALRGEFRKPSSQVLATRGGCGRVVNSGQREARTTQASSLNSIEKDSIRICARLSWLPGEKRKNASSKIRDPEPRKAGKKKRKRKEDSTPSRTERLPSLPGRVSKGESRRNAAESARIYRRSKGRLTV